MKPKLSLKIFVILVLAVLTFLFFSIGLTACNSLAGNPPVTSSKSQFEYRVVEGEDG